MKQIVFLLIMIATCSSFYLPKKKKPSLPKEFAYVPQGTWSLQYGDEDDIYYSHSDSSKRVNIPSFYFSKFEITNKQYGIFLQEIKNTISPDEYKKIGVDSTAWQREPSYYSASFWVSKEYFYHPKFTSHPVVNISYEGALQYCHWLQEKLQQDNLNEYTITVSLPTKAQWLYAAYSSYFPYSWRSEGLTDKKGNRLCNYRFIKESMVVKNHVTGKPELQGTGDTNHECATIRVDSFEPSELGFYNLCGNVAEMINEKGVCMGGSWNDYAGDVTTRSSAMYSGASSHIGFRPVIMVHKIGE